MITLLINRQQILERVGINGNIDTDKLVPHIITAQDIEAQTVLGTALYDKLLTDVAADTVAEPYTTLLNVYLVPMLVHYTASNLYLFHAYEVANGGIYRHQSQNSFTPEIRDVEKLSENQHNKATHYRARLVDYLCAYGSIFPEYRASQGAGMRPNNSQPSNQWNF